MSYRSKENVREIELEKYEYKYYNEMKKGKLGSHRVKISDSVYRCPYCLVKRNSRLQITFLKSFSNMLMVLVVQKKTLQTIISRSARARTVEEGIEYD